MYRLNKDINIDELLKYGFIKSKYANKFLKKIIDNNDYSEYIAIYGYDKCPNNLRGAVMKFIKKDNKFIHNYNITPMEVYELIQNNIIFEKVS